VRRPAFQAGEARFDSGTRYQSRYPMARRLAFEAEMACSIHAWRSRRHNGRAAPRVRAVLARPSRWRNLNQPGNRCVVMGLISDFVVASAEDAVRYALVGRGEEPAPPGRFLRAGYKNFAPLALEMLWAILRHEKWDVGHHHLEHVFHTKDGANYLGRFPDELVDLIAALDEAAMKQVADAWAVPQEVPGNAADLSPVLRDLKRLATQAQQSRRGLYLWVSL
jgi:hypothetical protein